VALLRGGIVGPSLVEPRRYGRGSMAGLIDVEILEETEDEVRARVPVADALRQPLGLVHGGVYATIADAITTRGGRAISNQTSFLRPITEGAIHVTARRRHQGRTTAVWEVDVKDDAGKLCALVRTTIYPGP
jgi:1,4-dihydroxy-2-naphthoyl-CoA hydrolase